MNPVYSMLRPFRLQYTSNLFVDLHKHSFTKLLQPAASHLALTGNIGRPEHPNTFHFLSYCSKHWDSVFWVPGPHELTNTTTGCATYKEKTMYAYQLCKHFKNIRLMNSNEAVFRESNVVLLGTPLWSPLLLPPKGQPEFERIYTSMDEAGPIPLTYELRNQWWKSDKLFLYERSLFWTIVYPDVNLIYLTHTIPTSRLLTYPVTETAMNRLPLDCYQANPETNVRAWIGGASGSTQTTRIGTELDTQMVAAVNSAYEYPFTNHISKKEYDPQCVLEVNPIAPRKSLAPSLPNLILPPILSSLFDRKPILTA